MSLKVYVSGPMTNMPQFNYPAFFDVASKLEAQRYTALNPAMVDQMHREERYLTACGECDNHRKHDWRWYMRRCIVMLAEADGIATLQGWERSKGASAEVALARALGLPVMPWQSWVLKAIEHDDPGFVSGTRRSKGQGITKPDIIHWNELGMPYCGTKGRFTATLNENWDHVTCQRCTKKKGRYDA